MRFESSFGRPISKTIVLLAVLESAGCTSTPSRDAQSATAPPSSGSAIEIPQSPPRRPLARVRVASDLANPRGIHVFADGSLLVAVAGTGDPSDANTGALLHLRDTNQDGDFDDA